MLSKKINLLIILALLASIFCLADDDEKKPLQNTITMAELRDHMHYLASDELGGRVVGTEGYRLATIYAKSQFRAAGLIPIFKDEAGKPTFLQKVPLVFRKYSEKSKWTFSTDKGDKTIGIGTQVKVVEFFGANPISKQTDLLFVGYGISEPESGWDDLKGLDLRNKVAVVMLGAPTKDGKPVLPDALHKAYLSVPGAQKKVRAMMQKGVQAFLFISNKELAMMFSQLPDNFSRSVLALEGQVDEGGLMGLIAAGDMQISKFIMEGQEFNPYSNKENPMEGYKTFPLVNSRMQLETSNIEEPLETWNVVGLIPGTDPVLKDEFVVIGGHLDHVAPLNGDICNGADDNASGSVGTIEIGEALAMQDNKRSILVCLWAAEESGLLGSQYFVANPPVKMEQIKVKINLDMIARTDQLNKESRAINALGTSVAAPAFKEFLNRVNSESVNWPLNFSDKKIGLGGSDHMNFLRKGTPVLFFFSGTHKDYHRPTDDPENLDWEKFLNVSRLACSLMDELANTELDLETFRKPVEKQN